MESHAVFTIAAQELKVNIRNRWTLIFAAVFGILALAICYFGLRTAGLAGFQGFTRTAASLLNLALYLIPVVSLSMAALSLTGEKGAGELLFAQPVTRSEILLGKVLGLFVSMAAATLFGFGLAGVVIASQAGPEGLARYLAFAGFALVLALVFLSLGALASVLAGARAKALGLSLFLWFFFVLFYDLLVIGVTFLLKERTANHFLFLSLFGNPVGMVRVSGLMALSDASIFGAAGAALLKFMGGEAATHVTLLAGLALWVAIPLAIAAKALQRQDL
jgi:Cu-processing system permease protein